MMRQNPVRGEGYALECREAQIGCGPNPVQVYALCDVKIRSGANGCRQREYKACRSI
jgi:hypothetical protein